MTERQAQIPDQDGGVRTGRQDDTTVGAEGAPSYLAGVPAQGAPQLSRGHFPELQALLLNPSAFIDRERQEAAAEGEASCEFHSMGMFRERRA